MPLTWITSSFKGIMCCFQVDLYVRHEVQDLLWGIEVGIDAACHESYVDISNLLMLVICLKDEEYGCCPTELEGALCHIRHKCALCNELPQVPQVETTLAVESVPRYRTLTHELEEYLAEVECGHLEEQVESLLQEGSGMVYMAQIHKRKTEYQPTLAAVNDDDTWITTCG